MNRRGFTLIEILVGAAVASVIGLAIIALMNTGMILSAKNISINLTSNSMRQALDRVEQVVQQGDTQPQLINTAGAPVASGVAAGIKFDRFTGSPYVITVGAGGLPAATTILTLTRSTNAAAGPPIPRPGDIVRIDSAPSTLRPRVQTAAPGAVSGSLLQPITVNLTAPLGTPVTPITSTVMTARLVRSVGLLVMPNNGRQELRYYDAFDTTANLNDPTKYIVVTDQIGVQAADTTPFSLVQRDGRTFVSFSLRVRAGMHDNRLHGPQNDDFSTFNRVETLVRPKTIP